MDEPPCLSADLVHQQITAVLQAWGMPADLVQTTADVMLDTDLAGVDSHGISMLMMYEAMRRDSGLNLQARPCVVQRSRATALVDAGAGLGHPAAVMAMQLAIEMAGSAGVGAVAVCNSHHFGAAGYYASMAAERGMLGLVTSTARTIAVVPTRASLPVLGTNPIAFAAPAGEQPPFLLDIATSTVAANKVKVYDLNGRALPPGWVLDGRGEAVTDAAAGMQIVFREPHGGLTPVGGTEAMASHKGYGLGLMAQILAGVLTGGAFGYLGGMPGLADHIGHFFLALNPAAFRPPAAFAADMDTLIETLHGVPPIDPARPVLVPGDPERASRAVRGAKGIPVPRTLAGLIRGICERCGAAYLLG